MVFENMRLSGGYCDTPICSLEMIGFEVPTSWLTLPIIAIQVIPVNSGVTLNHPLQMPHFKMLLDLKMKMYPWSPGNQMTHLTIDHPQFALSWVIGIFSSQRVGSITQSHQSNQNLPSTYIDLWKVAKSESPVDRWSPHYFLWVSKMFQPSQIGGARFLPPSTVWPSWAYHLHLWQSMDQWIGLRAYGKPQPQTIDCPIKTWFFL